MRMNISAAAVAVVMAAMLTACGSGLTLSSRPAEAAIGWYCVDNAETGIKDCEKRMLRNGVPIDDVVYERLGASVAGEQGPESHSDSPLTVINAIDSGSGLSVENRGPAPREVRSYVERSGERGSAGHKGDL